MDNQIEKEAVKIFLNKNCQDRINYELSSKKKRIEVFNKLCHNFNTLINNDYMEICNENEYSNIIKKLKSYGAQNSCYVLSYNTLIDGQYMNLDEALKMVVGYGPYYIECRRNDKIITMDFIYESDIKEVLECYIIEERELVEKIIKVAKEIMISIQNHRIKGGKDLRKLEKIISKFN